MRCVRSRRASFRHFWHFFAVFAPLSPSPITLLPFFLNLHAALFVPHGHGPRHRSEASQAFLPFLQIPDMGENDSQQVQLYSSRIHATSTRNQLGNTRRREVIGLVGAKWYIHAPPHPPPACACALRGTHQPAGRLPTCLVHRAHASPVRKCISHPKSLATFCPTPCCCTHPA